MSYICFCCGKECEDTDSVMVTENRKSCRSCAEISKNSKPAKVKGGSTGLYDYSQEADICNSCSDQFACKKICDKVLNISSVAPETDKDRLHDVCCALL